MDSQQLKEYEDKHLPIVAKVFQDEENILISMNIRELWLAISTLQLAYCHPGLSPIMKQFCKHIGDQMAAVITERHPDAGPILNMGWDEQFDVDQS